MSITYVNRILPKTLSVHILGFCGGRLRDFRLPSTDLAPEVDSLTILALRPRIGASWWTERQFEASVHRLGPCGGQKGSLGRLSTDQALLVDGEGRGVRAGDFRDTKGRGLPTAEGPCLRKVPHSIDPPPSFAALPPGTSPHPFPKTKAFAFGEPALPPARLSPALSIAP